MNRDEAKEILRLHRPQATVTDDPQLAEALALAKSDPKLSQWLATHLSHQESVRAAFRQIAPPAGLKEQIISEEIARRRRLVRRRATAWAALAALILFAGLGIFLFSRPAGENDFVNYRARMVRVALTGYAMDLETNDMTQIRAYLARQNAPAEYKLPAGLEKVSLIGCAVEKWHGKPVTMICFKTGQQVARGEQNDLWVFVADRTALKNVPVSSEPALAKVNRLATAAWTDGKRIYLLGVAGDEEMLRQYL
jgi:hypothetical protein